MCSDYGGQPLDIHNEVTRDGYALCLFAYATRFILSHWAQEISNCGKPPLSVTGY
jgi:hypothetical protein